MRRALRSLTISPAPACAALDLWLQAHPDLRTIAVYAALPGEVDLTNTIQRHPARRWVYPKIVAADLTFHRGDNLVPGPFQIPEPAPGSPAVPLAEIDAFLCPGLAFDPQGGRLGRGGGFYDRMLAKARPDALKIGICFPCQIVSNTFPEPHDIPMDEILH